MTESQSPVEAAAAVLLTPIPDAPRRHPIALAIEAEAMAIYHPGGGNTHRPEWVPDPQTGRHYLGVSTLVKKTASEYAERIMRQVEEEDESQGYWARRGNLAAWDHTRRITPFRENRLVVPLDAHHVSLVGIDLVGHVDGIRVSGPNGENLSFGDEAIWAASPAVFLTPLECKLFESATDHKVDLASRQDMLYSAMMHLRMGEDDVWPLADFHDAEQDPHARPLHVGALPVTAEVFGGSVHIDQGTEPKGFVQFIDDPGMPQSVFNWCVEKAAAIMVSVRWFRNARDAAHTHMEHFDIALNVEAALSVPGGVMDYVRSPIGAQEFAMDLAAIEANIDPATLAKHAIISDMARAAVAEAESLKSEHGAKACAIVFDARGPNGDVILDKNGNRLRTLVCELAESASLKVTAVPVQGGRSHWAKVSRIGKAWDSPEIVKEIYAALGVLP